MTIVPRRTTAPSVQVDVRQQRIERTFMAGTGFRGPLVFGAISDGTPS